jgi:hypothetical protein
MARWFSESYPEASQISPAEQKIRLQIVGILARYTTEMEGYSYYGSNPGIKEDDYEDVADDIMAAFGLNDAPVLDEE